MVQICESWKCVCSKEGVREDKDPQIQFFLLSSPSETQPVLALWFPSLLFPSSPKPCWPLLCFANTTKQILLTWRGELSFIHNAEMTLMGCRHWCKKGQDLALCHYPSESKKYKYNLPCYNSCLLPFCPLCLLFEKLEEKLRTYYCWKEAQGLVQRWAPIGRLLQPLCEV